MLNDEELEELRGEAEYLVLTEKAVDFCVGRQGVYEQFLLVYRVQINAKLEELRAEREAVRKHGMGWDDPTTEKQA